MLLLPTASGYLVVRGQPLEALRGFTSQIFFKLLKHHGAVPSTVGSMTDCLDPVKGLNQEELDRPPMDNPYRFVRANASSPGHLIASHGPDFTLNVVLHKIYRRMGSSKYLYVVKTLF